LGTKYLGGVSFASGRSRKEAMNHKDILGVLPCSKEGAESIKEIVQAMGLEISSYVDGGGQSGGWQRALGALIKWGWVACDERRKEEGHKFW
jgi:hypothetical protein